MNEMWSREISKIEDLINTMENLRIFSIILVTLEIPADQFHGNSLQIIRTMLLPQSTCYYVVLLTWLVSKSNHSLSPIRYSLPSVFLMSITLATLGRHANALSALFADSFVSNNNGHLSCFGHNGS